MMPIATCSPEIATNSFTCKEDSNCLIVRLLPALLRPNLFIMSVIMLSVVELVVDTGWVQPYYKAITVFLTGK